MEYQEETLIKHLDLSFSMTKKCQIIFVVSAKEFTNITVICALNADNEFI